MSPPIARVLIANRGEIAVRIIRACHELGLTAVAVYSDADAQALHVQLADEAYPLGASAPHESYLCQRKLLDVAQRARVDAIHPGYGFFSENADFAAAVVAAGIAWVGPAPDVIRALGSKTAARRLAEQAQVPIVPGTTTPLRDAAAAETTAAQIGYPVLLKAAAGGGGKGMRVVAQASDCARAFALAQGEAVSAFGNGDLYVEKLIVAPHHVEVQILADQQAHVVHLGERECSIQRRHQKIIEETPSPFITPETRTAMTAAAVRLAQTAGYTSAGTVEFLVDAEQRFYFLEVNTRLQVEHPITELVTGLDLVQLQLRIAAGEPLPFAQADVQPRGHALECRICAEDPAHNFAPVPGTIAALREPAGPGVRWESGIYAGFTVPMEYDPLLGKLCTWAATRHEAIARMARALRELQLHGTTTNIPFLAALLQHPDFQAGCTTTDFLERHRATLWPAEPVPTPEHIWLVAAAAGALSNNASPQVAAEASRWQTAARQEGVRRGPVA